MSRLLLRIAAIGLCCGISGPATAVSGQEALQQWIRQLGSDNFAAREAAQSALLDAGAESLEPLLAALGSDDPEVVWRVGQLLEQQAVATSDSKTLKRVCERLANVPGPLRQDLAMAGHRLRQHWATERSNVSVKRIQELGGNVIVGNAPVGIPLGGGAWLQGKPLDFGQPVEQVDGPVDAWILPELDVPQVMLPDIEIVAQEFEAAPVKEWLLEDVLEVAPALGVNDAGPAGGVQDARAPLPGDPPLRDYPLPDEPVPVELAEIAPAFERVRPLVDPDLEAGLDRLDMALPVANQPGAVDQLGIEFNVEWQVLNAVPVGNPIMFGQGVFVQGQAGVEIVVQRSIVIDENWQGTPADFELLGEVQGLIGLQLNGLAINDDMLEVVGGLERLQWLSLNRSEVDFNKLRSLMRQRPELSVQAAGTARMGIYGGEELRTGSKGCWVHSVIEGAPAEVAGIRTGDRLMRIDGYPIASFSELALFVSLKSPGDKLEIELKRGDSSMLLDVTLERREDN